jgi:pimeloyl-ACP methyl ester carboxylesterase
MAGPEIEFTMNESGEGAPVLVLHGGGGPATVTGLAAQLAQQHHVLVPTHPGWNGTPRPEWLSGIDDLAICYLREMKLRGLRHVTVIGSSLGGWLAAEMVVRDLGGLIGLLVVIDGVGVEVPGERIVDFFSLTPRGIAEHSYHEPDRFFVDPATLPPEQVALQRGNMATLRAIAGTTMADPKLLRRLAAVECPALVLWGESDRIATPAYGRAMAAAFGNGTFQLIEKAGHLPQIEQPAATLAAITAFAGTA